MGSLLIRSLSLGVLFDFSAQPLLEERDFEFVLNGKLKNAHAIHDRIVSGLLCLLVALRACDKYLGKELRIFRVVLKDLVGTRVNGILKREVLLDLGQKCVNIGRDPCKSVCGGRIVLVILLVKVVLVVVEVGARILMQAIGREDLRQSLQIFDNGLDRKSVV